MLRAVSRQSLVAIVLLCGWPAVGFDPAPSACAEDAPDAAALIQALQEASAASASKADRDRLATMVRDDQMNRLRQANRSSSQAWQAIKTRNDWQRFRDAHVASLRASLGQFPAPPKRLDLRVTGRIDGDGFRIHNVVFESRGLWVTANLYLPAKPRDSMPGILIGHSHHTPKTHGELQDMGMTWARAGCLVLVMDQLGHGERRQHPFAAAADYGKPYKVSRQDYYFRYDNAVELGLVGESLIGWMAWDLMRGVDLLLQQDGIDPTKIILLGAVAGGGDPAAVTAALDDRIAAAVPFNFGGPQPETRYPLPDDVETSFNYAGGGSWESTRNLRLSAAEGFLPWVIVGGIAPRRLVFAHEFSWDRPRDPVWKRLQTIYGLYGAEGNLAYTHGRGELRGQPPDATHCTHIGREHRKLIHEAFRRWFGIEVGEKDEFSARRDAKELMCMTAEAQRELKPKKLHEVLTAMADERLATTRKALADKTPAERRKQLRAGWSRILGNVTPSGPPKARQVGEAKTAIGGRTVQRLELEVEPGITLPTVLLLPGETAKRPLPVVLAVAHSGKEGIWRHRPDLLTSGVAVCTPDLRGMGETRSGSDRGRTSSDTSRSSTEQMLGGTILGARLRDLRSVLAWLRSRDDIDGKRIALWGESFVPPNPPDTDFRVPYDVDGRPQQSEPGPALLAMLGALYDDDVRSVYARGGLAELRSMLGSPMVYAPHDALVPGALTVGDLPDLVAALAPRPVRLEGLLDAFNRAIPEAALRAAYGEAFGEYRKAGKASELAVGTSPHSAREFVSATLAR
jgi:cephalosporin-C deacetylase-like acetyl esterase